jgi:hypothetical protein
MGDDDVDAREEALRYAAGLKGLSLVRTGDTFAVAEFKLSGATLDQVAAYLAADPAEAPGESVRGLDEHRRSDLRALLKAERAMLAELETDRRKAHARSEESTTTERALAEIRRRIAELSQGSE